VPRLLRARRAEDAEEARKIRKLAGSRHASADWIFRASIISLSWQGLRNARIAEELSSHPKTVWERIHRFNGEGRDGLGDRPRAGRRPRLAVDERSKIIALVSKNLPGKLLTEPGGGLQVEDETKAAYWTLDTLAGAAQVRTTEQFADQSDLRDVGRAQLVGDGHAVGRASFARCSFTP